MEKTPVWTRPQLYWVWEGDKDISQEVKQVFTSSVTQEHKYGTQQTSSPSIMSLSKPEDQLALELSCPICLQLYYDPVVLPCGHNYCESCISKTARNHVNSGTTPQCPECREEFQGMECLQKNFKLCSIVEGYRATATLLGRQPEIEPMRKKIFCDHCIDDQMPAVKVCLKCEVPLCSRHLQKHHEKESFRSHSLVDVNDLEVKGCIRHRRPLEYFCSNDTASLCATCIEDGQHQDHDVLTYTVAEEELRRSLDSRSKVISCKLQMTQSLLQKTTEEQAANVATRDKLVNKAVMLTDSLADLMNRERLHTLVEQERNQYKKTWQLELSEMEEQQQQLLEADRDATLALSETDPCVFIHRYIQIQDKLKEVATCNIPPKIPSVTPLDINTLQMGLKTQDFHSEMTRLLHSLHILLNPLDLSFNLCTAHPNLILSTDLRTIKNSSTKQQYTEHPERFTSVPQVMCSQEFSSGEHIWVVEVGPNSMWSLGLCYKSIPRRGDNSRLGHNSMSWRLQWKNGKLTACHSSSNVTLGELTTCLLRIEIELNYEAGTLRFHSTKGRKEHLYTFRTVFKEPVYPAFSIHSNTPESWITLHTGM